MKVTSIASKQERNCLALRRGMHLILKQDSLRFKQRFFITIAAYPNTEFPITLSGAKDFLKNGTIY